MKKYGRMLSLFLAVCLSMPVLPVQAEAADVREDWAEEVPGDTEQVKQLYERIKEAGRLADAAEIFRLCGLECEQEGNVLVFFLADSVYTVDLESGEITEPEHPEEETAEERKTEETEDQKPEEREQETEEELPEKTEEAKPSAEESKDAQKETETVPAEAEEGTAEAQTETEVQSAGETDLSGNCEDAVEMISLAGPEGGPGMVMAATKAYTSASVLSGSASDKISRLKSQFPTDKYWNHYKGGSHQNGYKSGKVDPCTNVEAVTSSPCKGHSGAASTYMCNYFSYLDGEYNTIYNCKQCCGFAVLCSYKYTGQITSIDTRRLQSKSSIGNLKAGDILYVDTSSGKHYAFVAGVSGNTITTAEANYGKNGEVNSCRIQWTTRYKTDASIAGYFSSSTVKVSSITLSAGSAKLDPGKTLQLSASVSPSNAMNKAVSWSTSNSSVAAVSSSGLVTALRPGTATITATAQDGSGKTAKCTITTNNVTVKVTGIALSSSSLNLAKGGTARLSATASPSYATNTGVSWSSSNTGVATVDASGNIKAVGVGSCTITATAKDGSGKTARCTVKVTATVSSVDMHRLYNPNSGEHFYTADVNEKNALVKYGWKYEGVAWKAPKSSNTPVYRVYNANAGDHHYTMNKAEKDGLVKLGWKYEGIGWYSDDSKGVPLYRQYNPNATSGSHNYTSNKAENDYLVKLGWKAEGISWYGMK